MIESDSDFFLGKLLMIFSTNGLKIFLVSIFALSSSICAENFIKDSVAKAMDVSPNKIEFKNLRKGMTSAKNLKFDLEGKQYIAKVFHKRKKEEAKEKEIAAVKIFSDLNLGTKLVAAAKDNSFYIREYVPGKTLKFADVQNEKVLKNTAKAMKKLHEFKSDVSSRNLESRAEKHFKSINKKDIAVPTGFEKSFEQFKNLCSKLKNSKGFCHNDLNPHNILLTDDERILFIDFGNSGMGNIYEELGYFTALSGIFDDALSKFLDFYFERKATKDELETVKLAQKIVLFVSACVYFDFSETKNDKKIKKEKRIEKLDSLLKSGDLPAVFDIIKNNKVPSVRIRNKDRVRQYALACYKEFAS